MKNLSQRFAVHSRFKAKQGTFSSKKPRLTFMKTTSLFFGAMLLCSTQIFAQHPLVGTWEMISIKGLNADGEKFSIDTTTVRETKIITSTHYMLIAQDVQGDSLVFNRCYAGEVRLEGNKYIEIPTQASIQIFDNVKTDFSWEVKGDEFIQSGTFIRPDGKKIVLDAMVFKRVKPAQSYPDNPAIGTWSQLSSSYTNFDGTKDSHTSETTTRFQLVTATHWMRISHRDKKFEHATGGTYSMLGGKTYPSVKYASFPLGSIGKIEMTERVKGDKLYVNGLMTASDGKKLIWDDIFQRVK